MTEYRRSPAGVLVKRDNTRSAGWMVPHRTVIDAPAGDRCHRRDQQLADVAVESWETVVRPAHRFVLTTRGAARAGTRAVLVLAPRAQRVATQAKDAVSNSANTV